MTSDEIREAFLQFFESRGHQRVTSSSLIPRADPSLLFVNAGMVQFKDVFLGADKRPYSRATTSQKSVRAGGKHNDLDSVGRTARHHTFFEMLGNFSFGDYFKRDAIDYAWIFLTEVMKLPKEQLWVTIYEDDDEADALWQEVAGVAPERIIRLGEHDNFWAMGDTGPCGPCSEIHVDRGEALRCSAPECFIGKCDCDRWLEVWNLVFMQFERDAAGKLTPLPRPSIDTGMGLERIASLLQNVSTNYDTDLLQPIVAKVVELSGVPYDSGEAGFPHRVIADHARACTFLISDGVLPGNEGRGYVLRRIMRRAIRFGRKIGLEEPFMGRMSEAVVARMCGVYPELNDKKDFVIRVLTLEEERFGETLATGMNLLEDLLGEATRTSKILSGVEAFRLYDTFGFPYELTEEIALEHGLTVDSAGFEREMNAQRERARAARRDGGAGRATFLDYDQLPLPETTFLGYSTVEVQARIESLAVTTGAVEEASEGQEVEVVLNETPFYAEGGGQVGDTGVLLFSSGSIEVQDTFKVDHGLIAHRGVVASGTVMVNETVTAQVGAQRRADIARNHTATHLLHAALRQVLGPHVQQAGSLVAPDRLRFDFSHITALSSEEVAAVERLVNENIREDWRVEPHTTGYQEAIQEGALAFFDEKYGSVVRIVEVRQPEHHSPHFAPHDGVPEYFSKELCGGTHCSETGEIGFCYVVAESSIGAGVRRLEAVTGRAAEALVHQRLGLLDDLARQVSATPLEVPARVAALQESLEQERRRTHRLQQELARLRTEQALDQVQLVEGVKLYCDQVPVDDNAALREVGDVVRDRLGSGVVVLAALIEERPSFLVAVTKDLVERGVHAGQLAKEVAAITGGSGGGRPELAQAGGKDASKLGAALQQAPVILKEHLSKA